MMHDFSRWSGLVVLQPKQKTWQKKKIKDKTGSKKTIFMLLADHDQKWINQKNKKKLVTDVNYIPRPEKFRENEIRGEMLRFKFNKKICRERLPKFEFGNLGKRQKLSNTLGTLATFQTCQTFPDVFDVPLHIYIVISHINSFSF